MGWEWMGMKEGWDEDEGEDGKGWTRLKLSGIGRNRPESSGICWNRLKYATTAKHRIGWNWLK